VLGRGLSSRIMYGFVSPRVILLASAHISPVMGSGRVNPQFDGMPDPTDPDTGPIG